MNLKTLAFILGTLIRLLAGFLALFGFIALIFYSDEKQEWAFFISAIITLFAGISLRLYGKKITGAHITFREGFAVSGLGWILVAAFGALPFIISGDIPSFTDAFFESMSGFTTTGASILSDIESKGHAILLWRSFSHWLGGMGVIVLTIALLPALGIGGMQLFKAEVPGPTADKIAPRIGQTAKMLYVTYTILTIVEFVLLEFGGMNTFEAACHTFGTLGTGGFSPLNGSIGQYAAQGHPSALFFEIVIMIFMFLAGANFSLHYNFLLKGNYKTYFRDSEFKFYLGIIIITISFMTFDLLLHSKYLNISEAIRHSSFSVLSIITTTGYGTEDFDKWSSFSRFTLIFLMFIGGMAGSTSGGMKVVRIVTMIKQALKQIQQTVHPKKIYSIRFGYTHITKDVMHSINSFVVIFILLYILGVSILSFTNYDFESIATMVIACLGNIGPGLSKVGPKGNYADLPVYAKWVLSYFMVLGRLELFPILVLFLPRLWKK